MTGRYKAYPEYRKSMIEWMDDVPVHWQNTPLKYMAIENNSLFLDGDWIESKDISSDGIRYITTGNVGEGVYKEQGAGFISDETFKKLACTEVFEGDVLLSRLNAPIGRACIVPNLSTRIVTSVDNVIFRPDPHYYKQFLVYLFSSASYFKHTSNLARGATMQRISRGLLGNIRVAIPSLEEQQKIANFLDHETAKIDTLITKQEKLIELLKEKRQSVISHAVTKGLNPDAPMKDSGVEWLGDVPEHWDVTKFSYAIDFLEGPGILAADFHDEGVPLLRIQNVKEVFVTDNFKTYLDPLKVKEKWDHFRVEKGDLLISASASTGLISEVDERTVGAVPYTGLIRLKPMTQDITAGFIRYIVQSDLFYEQIKLLQTGSTIQHFGPIHLQQMKVILPPVDEQDRIVDQIQQSVKHIDSLIESAYRIIDLTKERKTALISAAVTGKIDVCDWQEPTYQESAQR
ncbi:restriction endonuclease subunit S [Vibrio diabolicus]|uniref:restriction endonuclease subunit S n=1 Tax=Vibrio diabolicus TaxID=50719 RepID=UPI003752F60C